MTYKTEGEQLFLFVGLFGIICGLFVKKIIQVVTSSYKTALLTDFALNADDDDVFLLGLQSIDDSKIYTHLSYQMEMCLT